LRPANDGNGNHQYKKQFFHLKFSRISLITVIRQM
jgi:hypothetical protein